MANATAAAPKKPASKKLNLTILATSLNDFVEKVNGLQITQEDQEKINAAIQAYFLDLENELAEKGDVEVTVQDLFAVLKKNGVKIQIVGASNAHLETIVNTLAPTRTGFDWKAFAKNVLKYTAIVGVGVGVGYYGSQYMQNRRTAKQAAEAHRNSNVTSISATRRAA